MSEGSAEFPALREGQIWQCLKQFFTVKIVRLSNEDGGCWVGTIRSVNGGEETGKLFVAAAKTTWCGEPCYVRRLHPNTDSPHTLVRLLYDPAS